MPKQDEQLFGFYENMSFEDYAAAPGINGSSIVHMRRSPMFYKFMRDNPQPPTSAMILGTATHRMILEPNRVGDFAVWDQETQGRRFGKVWDAFRSENEGKLILTATERDAMIGMAVGARCNLPVRKYADAKGKCEVSMFWKDQVSGRQFKARVDKIIPSTHTVPDLKTCRSCQRHQFGAQAYKLGYHIKEAIYSSGYFAITGHKPHVKLLAIESKAPFESAVYRITSDVILQGLEELDVLLKMLDECEKSGTWPAEEEEETDLLLPTWATSTEQREDLEIEGLEME